MLTLSSCPLLTYSSSATNVLWCDDKLSTVSIYGSILSSINRFASCDILEGRCSNTILSFKDWHPWIASNFSRYGLHRHYVLHGPNRYSIDGEDSSVCDMGTQDWRCDVCWVTFSIKLCHQGGLDESFFCLIRFSSEPHFEELKFTNAAHFLENQAWQLFLLQGIVYALGACKSYHRGWKIFYHQKY